MCGIFGYVGPKDPIHVCLQGLKLLEYRGYDSSGIAGVHQKELLFWRETGKILNLESALQNRAASQVENAISHTRWATHGKSSHKNAHPQLDTLGHFAIVHNGIITNHYALRRFLEAEGVCFLSDTDTEVIAQLMAYHYKGNLLEAFQETLSQLEGFWAMALIHKDHGDQILVAAKENPAAIALSADRQEAFISSDVNAFQEKDLDIFFLKDHETAVVTAKDIQIFNNLRKHVLRDPQRLSLQGAEVSKNGFPHFMLKEIFEQPDVIRQTLHGRYDETAGTAIFPELTFSEEDLRSVQQVIILACGTSWHAGCIAATWFEEKARIQARAEIASEFRHKDPILPQGTLVIAISQSGETFDTLASVRLVKQKGAKVLAICNVPNSTLTREADSCLFLRAGPEISVCSTKAFTGQLTILALFALYLSRLKTLSQEEGVLFLQHLQNLPIQVDQVLRLKEEVQEIAKKYASFHQFFFLGRHYMYATSLEAALKLKEISYINAMGYPAGEMKHGPIALVDPSLAVIGLCGNKKTEEKMLSNLMEIKAREAPIVAFSSPGCEELKTIATDILWLPETIDELSCVLYSVAAQLLAYYIAVERGTEIDQPRNLAKSVTVE